MANAFLCRCAYFINMSLASIFCLITFGLFFEVSAEEVPPLTVPTPIPISEPRISETIQEKKIETPSHSTLVPQRKVKLVDRTFCRSKFLKLKDCHIQAGSRKLHVWNDKIILTTSVDHVIKELPISNEADWDQVKWTRLNQRDFLELKLWTQPQGEGGVASLWWAVFEIDDHSLELRTKAIIQKRRRNDTSEKLRYDKKVKYGLRVSNKKIFWHVDRQQGSF